MDPRRSDRTTYYERDEQTNSLMLELISDLKVKHPNCESLLAAIERFQKLAERPQIAQIFQEHPQELAKLVRICLEPEAAGIRSGSAPFLARNILKREPNSLMISVITLSGDLPRCLFDFLRNRPGDTALGYFKELMHTVSEEFQSNLVEFLQRDKETLGLCLANCHFPHVFYAIFQMLLLSSNQQQPFKQSLMRQLLQKVLSKDHQSEHAQIIAQVLDELLQNMGLLNDGMKQCVFNTLNEEYSKVIIEKILVCWEKQSQTAQDLITILHRIIQLYKKLQEVGSELELFSIQDLELCVITIIKSMNTIVNILRSPCNERIISSNGQEVTVVGMVRYKTLQLLQIVLELQPKFVSAHYGLKNAGILTILEEYIVTNPWNNLVHSLVCQIVTSLIERFEDYSEFRDNYTGRDGFLAFLISTFRNHDYVYLNTMNTSTFGYIHYLYKIARAVCLKLDKSQTLRKVMNDFESWKTFLIKDMQEYESKLQMDLGESNDNLANRKLQNHTSIKRIIVNLNDPMIPEPEEEIIERFYEVIPKDKDEKFNVNLRLMSPSKLLRTLTFDPNRFSSVKKVEEEEKTPIMRKRVTSADHKNENPNKEEKRETEQNEKLSKSSSQAILKIAEKNKESAHNIEK